MNWAKEAKNTKRVWRDLDTLPSKSLFIIFFVKYINTYIYQGQFKLIKTNSEDIYNITKKCIFKKCFLIELSISKNHEQTNC